MKKLSIIVILLLSVALSAQVGKIPNTSANNTWTGTNSFSKLTISGASGSKCLQTDANGKVVESAGACNTSGLPSGVKGDGDQGLTVTKKISAGSLAVGTTLLDGSEAVDIRAFGAKPSNTDNSTAITNAANAAATSGACVTAGAGVYAVQSGITWPAGAGLCLRDGATIRATAAMAAMIQTPLNTPIVNKRFTGGALDGNGLATTVLDVRQCRDSEIDNIRILGATTNGIVLGDTAANATSYACNIGKGVHIVRKSTDSQVSGSHGVWYRYAGDSFMDSTVDIQGYDIGAQTDMTNVHLSGHPWAHTNQLMSKAFVVNVGPAFVENFYADTPQDYCVYSDTALNITISNGMCYNGVTGGTDNQLVGIYFNRDAPYSTVANVTFYGTDSSHRIKQDIQVVGGDYSTLNVFSKTVANVVSAGPNRSSSVFYMPLGASIGGEVVTYPTHATWRSDVSGALTSTFTSAIRMTPVHAITITRMEFGLGTAPVGCSTAAVVSLYNVTDSSILASVTLVNGTQIYDSGAISVAVPAGKVIAPRVSTAAASCGTAPSSAYITMQYKPQ